MNQPTCTRRLQFCCGHRVMGHENKCAHLHGHNYVVELTARAAKLDGIGRVIDFSVLKDKIGGWIERQWDHGFVLNVDDVNTAEMIRKFRPHGDPLVPQKLYIIPDNPTAECMAAYLLRAICPDLLRGTGVEVCKVKLWETENCFAEASL